MVSDSSLVEKAMLDGGPMHGIRRVLAELSSINLPQFVGSYRKTGRNEAGIAMFRWEKV